MALLLLLLVKFIFVPIGLRVSNGRVSIIPLIVSAGPTITLSHGSSMFVKLILFSFKLSSISSFVLTILCFGTGGAFVFGTSNSHVVIFSELFDISPDKLVLFERFTRLDAPVTFECGFSIRFTIELSATFGDDFRGGNGGAVKLWLELSPIMGADAATATDDAVADWTVALLIVLFIIWGRCC